jgi:hypothetical protein
MKKYASALASLMFVFASHAYATDFFVSVEGGRSNTDFNPHFTPDGVTNESADSTAYSAAIALKFESQVVLGAGFAGAFSDDFLGTINHFHLFQEQLYVGYRFKINDHFRITPQVGVTHWELNAEQSKIFGNDKDDKKVKYTGNDIYGQINLEFPVSKLMTIVGSYSRTNYDFGRTGSVQAGVIFEFD